MAHLAHTSHAIGTQKAWRTKMSSTLKRSMFALMSVGAVVGVALITIQAVQQAPVITMSARAPSASANHVYMAGTLTGL